MVKLLPLQTCHCVDWVTKHGRHDEGIEVDGDLPKVFGIGGSNRCADPLDAPIAQSKLHIFELCGLGELK